MVALRTSDPVFQFNPRQEEAIIRASDRFQFSADEQDAFVEQLQQVSFEERETLLCAADPYYFISTYVYIYDNEDQGWIPFELWPEQIEVLWIFHLYKLVVGLKARQLGITWLALAYALWMMLFAPIATVLLYSRRDDEAMYLISDERLKGMYKKLPDFLKANAVEVDSAHQFKLSNGSVAYAFPTTAGDGYTATLVIADEADVLPDLGKLLRMVKPTIDAGGKLFLISRSNKDEPGSLFKQIYKAAKAGLNNYKSFFLPWWVRPSRTPEWYEQEKKSEMSNKGSLDTLYEQYPATDDEALAPASENKRVPGVWLEPCFEELSPLGESEMPRNAPDIPGLKVYKLPQKGASYVIGCDCAEGLPTSDDSTSIVLDAGTGEEAANLVGKLTPENHAFLTGRLADWYNGAGIMPENNNHGHSFITELKRNGHGKYLLKGHNGKEGWTSNGPGKIMMYDAVAAAAKSQDTQIHDRKTYDQILSIEKATLRAPSPYMDDVADGFALAMVARSQKPKSNVPRKRPVKGLWNKPNPRRPG